MNDKKPKFRFAGKVKQLLCLNDYINICDNNLVIIENCKKILDCNEVMARVMTTNFQVEIWGSNLSLSNYCSECVEVNGVVESVALTARSVKEKK